MAGLGFVFGAIIDEMKGLEGAVRERRAPAVQLMAVGLLGLVAFAAAAEAVAAGAPPLTRRSSGSQTSVASVVRFYRDPRINWPTAIAVGPDR